MNNEKKVVRQLTEGRLDSQCLNLNCWNQQYFNQGNETRHLLINSGLVPETVNQIRIQVEEVKSNRKKTRDKSVEIARKSAEIISKQRNLIKEINLVTSKILSLRQSDKNQSRDTSL